jgi:hypothetical protein
MFFRQDATIRGLRLLPDTQPTSFTVPEESDVVVSLRPVSEEEIERARNRGRQSPEFARGSAEVQVDAPPAYYDSFVSIAQRRLPESSPRSLLGTGWVDNKGNLVGSEIIHADHLANDLQEYINGIHASLRRAIRAVFQATAWRMALDGPRDPVSFGAAHWSLDGKKWERLPTGATLLTLSDHGLFQLNAESTIDIQKPLDSGRRGPLAHALWREAAAQRGSNPRSAILIGIAALEVGLKQLASMRIPDADWLIKEAQSPPVVKMLARFLPDLPPLDDGTRFERPSKAILASVQKGVELRNDIAHKGVEKDPSESIVDEVLTTVRHLLWQFDVAMGIAWAEQFVASGD